MKLTQSPDAISERGRRQLYAIHATLSVFMIAALILLLDDLSLLEWSVLAPVVSAAVLINSALLYGSGLGVWTAAGAFGLVFIVFHFGLVLLLGTGVVDTDDLPTYTLRWFESNHARQAAALSLIGWLSFTTSVQFGRATSRRSWPARATQLADTRLEQLAGVAGAALVLVAVAIWILVLTRAGGIEIAFGSYADYLDATDPHGSLISPIWVFFALGITLLAVARGGFWRRIGWLTYGCFALVALPLGLRGEVLFPLLAGAVVLRRRTWAPRARTTLLLVVTTGIGVGFLASIRAVGVKAFDTRVAETAIWAGLAELGGSLHPVQKVVEWRAQGDPFALGATYWAPVERGLLRLVPVVERLPAEADGRLMNVVVNDRVGPIGFSVVAEAFRNFGVAGVVCVLGLAGALLYRLDHRSGSAVSDLWVGVMLTPILLHIRNSFVPVPAQMVVGATLIIGLLVLSRGMGWRSASPIRPSADRASQSVANNHNQPAVG